MPAKIGTKHYCSLPKRKRAPLMLDDITGLRSELILANSNKWTNGTLLRYYFFNDPEEGAEVEKENGNKVWKSYMGTEAQMDVVRKAFKMWADIGIGVKFKEVKDRSRAEIRIAFLPDGESWSYEGRDILEEYDDARTMNFGWNIAVRDRHNGIDTALHEIGHTLGFPHEHQNPFAGIKWDKEKVYKDLARKPNYWSRNTTYQNIIKKIRKEEVRGSTWDPDSIMHYPFDPGLVLEPLEYKKSGIKPSGGLSPQDISYALALYPSKNETKDVRINSLATYPVIVQNGKQQNFIFTPPESRSYNIETYGDIDTVLVLWEKKSNGELNKIAADDNSGSNKNAKITCELSKDKTYTIHVKVNYAKPGSQASLMIS